MLSSFREIADAFSKGARERALQQWSACPKYHSIHQNFERTIQTKAGSFKHRPLYVTLLSLHLIGAKGKGLINFLRFSSSSAGVSCLFLFFGRLFFTTILLLSSDLSSVLHLPINIPPGCPAYALSLSADENLLDMLELVVCTALLDEVFDESVKEHLTYCLL